MQIDVKEILASHIWLGLLIESANAVRTIELKLIHFVNIWILLLLPGQNIMLVKGKVVNEKRTEIQSTPHRESRTQIRFRL